MVNISGLNRAAVLAALYNRSQPLGMGFLHFQAGNMQVEEAETLLVKQEYFEYLKGRVMKVKLPFGDIEFDEWLYDLDNGPGAAQRAVDAIR